MVATLAHKALIWISVITLCASISSGAGNAHFVVEVVTIFAHLTIFLGFKLSLEAARKLVQHSSPLDLAFLLIIGQVITFDAVMASVVIPPLGTVLNEDR